MRVFYASDTTPNADFSSNLWRNNLLLPLLDLGHEVVEFNYDFKETFKNLDPSVLEQKVFIDRHRPILTGELLRQLRAAHAAKPVDLFFSYFYDACVLPEAIDDIRAMGITTVNWYCNGSYQLHLVSEISPHYDWCLVPEKFRMRDYVVMGARPVYCQEAANPNIYRPHAVPQEYDVTFVGQAYGDRPSYIQYLLNNGINVRVWGSKWNSYAAGKESLLKCVAQTWRRWRKSLKSRIKGVSNSSVAPVRLPVEVVGGILSDEEMIKMYSRSKINLGFSTCGESHKAEKRILQVRLRDFEVPMCGGFYMVEYMEEMEEFFNIGKEIICYLGPEDLVEKVKYYLSHDSEREAIRRAGYERCRRDHSWHKRFEMVFKTIGLEN
jgi:spore maturation protein CgeB